LPLVGRIWPLAAVGTLMMVADVMSVDSHTGTGSLEQRLFELAPDPLVVTKIDGGVVRVNPAACAIAGRTEEELLAGSY